MSGGAGTGPTGTVTMLFTDIEGSTEAVRALGQRWPEALAVHHELLGDAIREHGGFIEGTEGDAFFATFTTPGAALAAAHTAQSRVRAHAWPEREIRVRMGIHTGVIERTSTGTVGLEIHRAARIGAAAHGRQVLVSAVTRAMAPEEFTLEDLGEHRLKDFPQPARLFHLVVDGLTRDAFGPPRTLRVSPTNLPALEGAIVGREAELDRIRAMLTGETHLLSLTGRGGTGKTRLTLAAGAELLDVFPGGVWFVPLADFRDAGQAMSAIAEPLGVSEAPLLSGIAERLAAGDTLLILDNLEQLRGAADTVDAILSAAPAARILISSQVPLQLRREHVLTLGPLDEASGVQLFLEHAGRRGTLTASEGSLATIAELCQHLDGLPLAIELAAARTMALTPEELLRRLSDDLSLLSTRERDRPVRQRSLRATIEWSLSLLEPEDAELFATLSVFAQTFALSDVEALVGEDALDGIEALLESSFIRRVATGDLTGQFTMAQALRTFGQEQLREKGRLDAVREMHARWVLARVNVGWAMSQSGTDESPIATVEGLTEDARLAWEFTRERDPLLHFDLISGFAACTGDWAVDRDVAVELDRALATSPPPGLRLAGAHQAAGWLALNILQHEKATAHFEQARALALTHGPSALRVYALCGLVHVMLTTDPSGVRALAEQAIRESEVAGGRALAVCTLAQVDIAEGRVEIEPLIAEQLDQTTDPEIRFYLRHYHADCALLREDGSAGVIRYGTAVREAAASVGQPIPTDLEGLAMSLALLGRADDALEVDAIAEYAKRVYNMHIDAPFWIDLVERHLGPIRRAQPDGPGPGGRSPADQAGADPMGMVLRVERALEIAESALQSA